MEIDKDLEPILSKNPFFLKGEEWKTVRSILSTCFTSGKVNTSYTVDYFTPDIIFIAYPVLLNLRLYLISG